MSRRCLVIANPLAGTFKAARLCEEFQVSGRHLHATVVKTRYCGHAVDIAAASEMSEDDIVVVIGGDGTVCEVVNGLFKRGADRLPVLCVVPAGGANCLARRLAIGSVPDALCAIETSRTLRLPLVSLDFDDGKKFKAHSSVAFGLVATVNVLAEKARWLGLRRHQIVSAPALIGNLPFTAHLLLDDGRRLEVSVAIIARPGLRRAGKLSEPDLLITTSTLSRSRTYWQLLAVAASQSGGSPQQPYARFRTNRARVVVRRDDRASIDGEVWGRGSATISVGCDEIRACYLHRHGAPA